MDTCADLTAQVRTYVVRACVAEHVVERIRLRDVFRGLADDDCELDLVVGQVLVHGLRDFRDRDGGVGANERGPGLVEEDGVPKAQLVDTRARA